jgi:hypothetical protein
MLYPNRCLGLDLLYTVYIYIYIYIKAGMIGRLLKASGGDGARAVHFKASMQPLGIPIQEREKMAPVSASNRDE